jgi:hypothetical protein
MRAEHVPHPAHENYEANPRERGPQSIIRYS